MPPEIIMSFESSFSMSLISPKVSRYSNCASSKPLFSLTYDSPRFSVNSFKYSLLFTSINLKYYMDSDYNIHTLTL